MNSDNKDKFNPTKKGKWTNCAYLIRRIISESVQEHAHYLRGIILDYGCGSKPYKDYFESTEYIGIDVDISGHPANEKMADVFFDGDVLPFEDHKFDGVLASEVFEHVFGIDKTLMEIHRVLKPSGRLLITCPFVWPLHEQPFDFARYTPYALTKILEDAGFRILVKEQKGTAIEVIGQLFILEVIPEILKPIEKMKFLWRFHSFAYRLMTGSSATICLLLSKFLHQRKDLYMTNVLVAEKI